MNSIAIPQPATTARSGEAPVRAAAAGPWWRRLMPFSAPLDPSTGLLTRDALFARAERSMLKGDANLTVILLDVSDLHELREIYGSRVRRAVVAELSRKVRAVAGSRGYAGRAGSAQLAIVLRGVSMDDARAQLHKVFGDPVRIEYEAGPAEVVLVPEVAIDQPDEDDSRLDPLLARMYSAMARRRQDEQRRQMHMERERSRHTRPGALDSLA